MNWFKKFICGAPHLCPDCNTEIASFMSRCWPCVRKEEEERDAQRMKAYRLTEYRKVALEGMIRSQVGMGIEWPINKAGREIAQSAENIAQAMMDVTNK